MRKASRSLARVTEMALRCFVKRRRKYGSRGGARAGVRSCGASVEKGAFSRDGEKIRRTGEVIGRAAVAGVAKTGGE